MNVDRTAPAELAKLLPASLRDPAETAIAYMQHGTFQRSMCLMVAGTSLVSGAEVAYEHYRGGYSNPVMYTPVALSGLLSIAGVVGFFSDRAAKTFLRWTAYATLADGLVGFGFHIRGIARKPGGWRLPITNLVMGPPLFAPLLFGTSAYLGVIASYLQREEEFNTLDDLGRRLEERTKTPDFRREIQVGRFQKHLCVVCAVGTIASGAESWYSHYKDNFKMRVQWSPIIITPLLAGTALLSLRSKRVANTLLPVMSAVAMLDGVVGTYFHVKGIAKRSGGTKKPLYNILYGPPIFAPMLFAACGMLGMMAYFMRRERR